MEVAVATLGAKIGYEIISMHGRDFNYRE